MYNILAKEGYEVLEAENGITGLETIGTEKPDCVFLDLLMPEMDGFEFLKHIQDQKITVPIIVFTADIQDTSKDKCLNLRAAGFINTPPKPEEILSILSKIIDPQ